MPRTKSATDKFYDRRLWRDKLRPMVLARDPLCVICLQTGETRPMPSTVVDHIKAFATAATAALAWDSFTSLSNLRGICKRHHDEKTATADGGFGNVSKTYIPQRKVDATGSGGREFCSTTVSQESLDKALAGIDELLKDLSE